MQEDAQVPGWSMASDKAHAWLPFSPSPEWEGEETGAAMIESRKELQEGPGTEEPGKACGQLSRDRNQHCSGCLR